MVPQYLTKSRYVAGLQCQRRLWSVVHDPLPNDDLGPDSASEIGREIGAKARLLFSDGILVDEEPWQHHKAAVRTIALMADDRIPAIFEAAFEFDGIRIRVDVMERLPLGTWGLREVKSSTGVKEHYLDDIALQLYVLHGLGIIVSSVELLHVNTNYVRGNNGINWRDFFARVDIAELVAARLIDLPSLISPMLDCLALQFPPDVEPGRHCGTPYGCEFHARCTADKPDDWVAYLPNLGSARADALRELGVEAISAIPPDFPLTTRQAVIREVVASGRPYVSPDLAQLLADFGAPACYLDFEAMMPPIPLYEGTRPYQTIPFQWSLHARKTNGFLDHREFLACGDRDPRRAFAETLIGALETFEGPIIVYSAYEQTRLKQLALELPDLATALKGIIDRLADLLPVVRKAVYFPQFAYSASIKSVAPALCPGFGYDDLEHVANGGAAAEAFLRLASATDPQAPELEHLRASLLAYCHRDTMAMVVVHDALTMLAAA